MHKKEKFGISFLSWIFIIIVLLGFFGMMLVTDNGFGPMG